MAKRKPKFEQPSKKSSSSEYAVGAESLSVEDKLKVLESMGRPDLIEVFKEWQPRQATSKRKAAPLDQRVSITITDEEKITLQMELDAVNKAGEKVTASQFIRNRAMASVDINDWRDIAEVALNEIIDTEDNKGELNKRKRQLQNLIEVDDDDEAVLMYEKELYSIEKKFKKIVGQNEKRKNRLSGRMSMAEAETVKWRAARLSISTSDYLRFLIFGLLPDSTGDGHMSAEAKKRFYVSILEVSLNGWGEPPTIAHCSQCTNYLEEIRKLRDHVEQLQQYV